MSFESFTPLLRPNHFFAVYDTRYDDDPFEHPIPTLWSRRSRDLLTVAFHDEFKPGEAPTTWTFARMLLMRGMQRPADKDTQDVGFASAPEYDGHPDHPEWVRMTLRPDLTAPDETTELLVPKASLEAFLGAVSFADELAARG